MSPPGRSGPGGRVARNGLLAVASLGLTLAGFEVGLRVAGFDPNVNPRWRHHPSYGWTIDPDWPGMDGTNAAGFRFPAVAPVKPPGVRRLLILGDSFGQATVIPYASTFPGLLARWLAGGEGGGWEVLNFSVGGWGSAQQLIALQQEGLALQPDVVLLAAFPFNDVCDDNVAQAYTCSTNDFHRPYLVIREDRLHRTFLHPRRAWLRARSRLFALVENRVTWGIRGFRPGDPVEIRLRQRGMLASLLPEARQPPEIRDGWRVLERIVREMRDELSDRGLPLVALVIPYARTFDPDWVASVRAQGLPIDPEHATRRVEEMFAGLGVPVIPLRQRIRASGLEPADYFFPDGRKHDPHLSRLGHQRTAAWVLEELRRLGLTDAVPPGQPASR